MIKNITILLISYLTFIVLSIRGGIYFLAKWQVAGVPIDKWVSWGSVAFFAASFVGFLALFVHFSVEPDVLPKTETQE